MFFYRLISGQYNYYQINLKTALKLIQDLFGFTALNYCGGKGSDTDKLSKIGLKNTDLTKYVNELPGASTARKYQEKVKKQLDPFKTKYNLA